MTNLTAPQFTDEAKAREYFENLRWPEGPFCPRCGSLTAPPPTRRQLWRWSSVTVTFVGSTLPTSTPVDRASHQMTDESIVFKRLGREFAGHTTVIHSANEYVRKRGFAHSNSA